MLRQEPIIMADDLPNLLGRDDHHDSSRPLPFPFCAPSPPMARRTCCPHSSSTVSVTAIATGVPKNASSTKYLRPETHIRNVPGIYCIKAARINRQFLDTCMFAVSFVYRAIGYPSKISLCWFVTFLATSSVSYVPAGCGLVSGYVY